MCKSKVIRAFISKHFLPIGTLFIIPLGIVFPTPAVYLQGQLPVVKICISTLFFVIGMKFRIAEIQSALRCYKETALGLIIVLFITPVVGTKLMMLPKFQEVQWSDFHAENFTSNKSWSIELPNFGPEEFRIGLQIFCVSPCASAFPTIVVTSSNGDRALTLLIAVMATVISVFTVPVMTTWLIPAFHAASVSSLTILPRVVWFILLPLIMGRLLRWIGHVKKIVTKLHTPLKFVTSGSLLVMFWVKISQATAKGDLEKFSPLVIVAVTALGTAVIASFLLSTFIFCSLLRMPMKSILPITVLSSARNSSIAIAVIESLPRSVGNKNLMFFPIIFVYLAMIVIINSFGAFIKIKKEENDTEQGKDTNYEEKQVSNTLTKENREILPLLEISELKSVKLTVVINPLENMG